MRNALAQAWIDEAGPDVEVQVRTGVKPASCASASTGTLLVELETNATPFSEPTDGVFDLAGTWSGTGVATSTPGHYRLFKSGGSECFEQGDVSSAISLATSDSAATNDNVLTFADTTGVVVGQGVAGPVGIQPGTTVVEKTSTTAKLSHLLTAVVGSGANVYFGSVTGDLWLSSPTVQTGETVTAVRFRNTVPGA